MTTRAAVLAAALAAIGLASGCAGPPARRPAPPPHPEVALDPRGLTPPDDPASVAAVASAGAPAATPAGGPVTFARHVAPLLHRHCAPCHHEGGGAPFSLLTYRDAASRRKQIGLVTSRRYMPPWQPAHGYNAFEGERRLSDDDIATIARWVEGGAPEGDPGEAPPPPRFPGGWRLGTPDLVVTFPDAVTVPADGPDLFRNFVLPDVAGAPRFVRAYEFLPGAAAVHHAELRVDETDRSRERDERDPAPGYAGMDAETAHYPEGHFLSWVPGKTPRFEPDGRAWELTRTTDLVVQLHLLPTGKPESFRPQVGLYFTDVPPSAVAPVNLRLGTRALDIPAGEARYLVRDTFTLPVDATLLSVMPHGHYICKDMKGWATLPDGTRRWLVRIPDWDFNWQDEYRYLEPIDLPRGTVLTMEYVYDNSAANERNPSKPPRRVVFGPNSADEMADLWVRVKPRGALDRQILLAAQGRHRALEDAAHLEATLAAAERPEATELVRLARLYQRAQWGERVLDALRRAVEADGENAEAQELLGLALFETRDLAGGLARLEAAARLAPDNAVTHYNHGILLGASARLPEAADAFRRAVALDPRYARAHLQLAKVLRTLGKADEAAGHERRAAELEAELAAAR